MFVVLIFRLLFCDTMLDQFKVLYTYKLAGWGARFTEKSFDSVFFEIERVVNVSVLILQTDKVDGVK